MADAVQLPPYDPDQALALTVGKAEIRDQILAGVLSFLASDGEVASLLDSGSLHTDPAGRGELAHRALGLARQAGLRELAQRFRDLTDALDARRIEEAEQVARALPEAIARARAAVAAQETGRR